MKRDLVRVRVLEDYHALGGDLDEGDVVLAESTDKGWKIRLKAYVYITIAHEHAVPVTTQRLL